MFAAGTSAGLLSARLSAAPLTAAGLPAAAVSATRLAPALMRLAPALMWLTAALVRLASAAAVFMLLLRPAGRRLCEGGDGGGGEQDTPHGALSWPRVSRGLKSWSASHGDLHDLQRACAHMNPD
jgi:hypothetical protein